MSRRSIPQRQNMCLKYLSARRNLSCWKEGNRVHL
ncbi:hypothetical protein OESDEN_02926 [Oesophagostomum dentatum]|uniref:Uncharacterized protein n=1 Tax=Oesophagostomum dentatum TaxID=61180 RepID=A0A0B1TLZ9_OESDE|nr:hypothetical protein OESDEN_02926 [Oesophagostomum dentatum]